jgi:hypothetical protein
VLQLLPAAYARHRLWVPAFAGMTIIGIGGIGR